MRISHCNFSLCTGPNVLGIVQFKLWQPGNLYVLCEWEWINRGTIDVSGHRRLSHSTRKNYRVATPKTHPQYRIHLLPGGFRSALEKLCFLDTEGEPCRVPRALSIPTDNTLPLPCRNLSTPYRGPTNFGLRSLPKIRIFPPLFHCQMVGSAAKPTTVFSGRLSW